MSKFMGYDVSLLQKYIRRGFIGVTIATASTYVVFNGLLLENYRLHNQLRSVNGKVIELNDDLIHQIDEILFELKLPKAKKQLLNFFHCKDRKIFSAGSLEFNNGAIIGIPYNYTYKTVQNIDLSSIQLPATINKMDWSSKYGQRLLNSLVLSNDAKKFSIAKEAYFADSVYIFIHTVVITVMCTLPYSLYDILLKMPNLNLSSNPFPSHLGLLLLASVFSFLMYLLLSDLINMYFSSQADKKAASMISYKYLFGGIEYYEKQIEHNKAMRKLASDGDLRYLRNGEERQLRIQIPLSGRLKDLNDLKEKFEKKRQQSKPANKAINENFNE